MLILIYAALLLVGIAFASGCGSRTVFIPEASPIRIGPRTHARVYTRLNGEWVLSDNSVGIPEGWYCVPPKFVEEASP